MHNAQHMHVLTIIITNFNCDLVWFNTLDRTHTTSLKSTYKGLTWFSNVVIDDWYYNLVTWEALKGINICEVKLGSSGTFKVKIPAREGCKQQDNLSVTNSDLTKIMLLE